MNIAFHVRRLLPALLFCLAVSPSLAQTIESLQAIVRSGICPRDLATFDLQDYSECRPMEPARRVPCMDRVNRENHEIGKYNKFVSECRRAGRQRQSAQPPNRWSERAAEAERRNADNARRQEDNRFEFETGVDSAVRKNDRVGQRIRQEGMRREAQEALDRARRMQEDAVARQRAGRYGAGRQSGTRGNGSSKIVCPGPDANMRKPRCWGNECACPYWEDRDRTEPRCSFEGLC